MVMVTGSALRTWSARAGYFRNGFDGSGLGSPAGNCSREDPIGLTPLPGAHARMWAGDFSRFGARISVENGSWIDVYRLHVLKCPLPTDLRKLDQNSFKIAPPFSIRLVYAVYVALEPL